MTMALLKMIDDGIRLGGQPSHIEVSPNEAMELFNELHTLTPTPAGFVITSKDGVSCKLLLHAKEISEIEMQRYVSNWKNGEWTVEYVRMSSSCKKIPIIIVVPTPATVHLHG